MVSSASLHLLPPLPKLWSSIHTHQLTTLTSLRFTTTTSPTSSANGIFFLHKPLPVRFAVTESDSPKSIEPDPRSLLQDIADSFDLSSDYFAQLPRDLRLDLNDAAFDLSNGPVLDQCGQELGGILLNVSRAWELADTSTSHSLLAKLPSMEANLSGSAKSALGKRLVSAGRRFQSMGQYGQGEPQKMRISSYYTTSLPHSVVTEIDDKLKDFTIAVLGKRDQIAKAMIAAGRALSASSTSAGTDEPPKDETRMLKFGELQVEITPDKANIGAVIGVVFGILSWEIAQGVQSIPESSLEYANDNALLLAKSLRLALLALFYFSTFLSAFTAVGLVLLGIQLRSKKN